MKKYRIVVSKEEHKIAWNQASKHNFAYSLADLVSLFAALVLYTYDLWQFSIPFIITSLIFNSVFFNRVHKELFDKGIIEEV